jgi:hypothetical protein
MQQGSQVLHYGHPELWERTFSRVNSIYGQSHHDTNKFSKPSSAPVSDRRPPDTNDALGKANKKYVQKSRPRKSLVKSLRGRAVDQLMESGSASLPKNYQSYPHFNNSCYITSPLELLYSCYLYDRNFWAEHVGHLGDDFGLKLIYKSFLMREQNKGIHAAIQVFLLIIWPVEVADESDIRPAFHRHASSYAKR